MKFIRNVNAEEFYKEVLGKDIICFGAGQMLWEAEEALKIANHIKVVLDNSDEKSNQKINLGNREIMVKKPEDLSESELQNAAILITSKYYRQMMQKCEDLFNRTDLLGFVYTDIKWKADLIVRVAERMKEALIERGTASDEAEKIAVDFKNRHQNDDDYLIIPKINIVVTERCSLSCKECRALVPHIANPKDVDFEEVKKEIDLILDAADEIIDIEPIGGETFLYSKLPEFIEYVLQKDKVHFITLTTNGTILPTEKLLQVLRDARVAVGISDYGHVEKIARLIQLFEKNKIHFYVDANMEWMGLGGFECRNRTQEELIDEYRNCSCQYTVKYIANGKLWLCSRAPRLAALDVYSNPQDYYELVNVEDISVIRNSLIESYKVEYAEACNYCNQGDLNIEYIKAGVQTDGRLMDSEYTVIKRSEYSELLQIRRKYERGV